MAIRIRRPGGRRVTRSARHRPCSKGYHVYRERLRRDPHQPRIVGAFRERLVAEAQLVNLRSAPTDGFNLQTSANPGGGRGGTCFGDSGGAVLCGGSTSNVIVAVTSFGLNANCRGVDFAYRTDQAAVIAWILSHVSSDETVQIVQI